MITRISAALSVIVFAMLGQHVDAQNVIRDYVKEYPVHYQPSDPWVRGVVFRNHIGHGGLFYNCDQQECKRNNPHITWNTQPYQCFPRRPIRTTINQQVCEVKQRILWGGSGCFSCETPACAQGCNQCGTCQSCQHSGHSTPAYYDHADEGAYYMGNAPANQTQKQAAQNHPAHNQPVQGRPTLLDRLTSWSNSSSGPQTSGNSRPLSQYNQPIANHQVQVDYRQSRHQQSTNQHQQTGTIRVAENPSTQFQYYKGTEQQAETNDRVVRELPKRGMKVIR